MFHRAQIILRAGPEKIAREEIALPMAIGQKPAARRHAAHRLPRFVCSPQPRLRNSRRAILRGFSDTTLKLSTGSVQYRGRIQRGIRVGPAVDQSHPSVVSESPVAQKPTITPNKQRFENVTAFLNYINNNKLT